MTDADSDSAHVKFPPPTVLLASILIGLGLHWLFPLAWTNANWRWFLGVLLLGAGVGVILYCALDFKRAQTDIKPWKTTSKLVLNHFYRFSRNPIYVSFVVIGLGASLLFNALWIAFFQIPLVLVIQKFVITKEESYLTKKFGAEYLEYKAKVRRWV